MSILSNSIATDKKTKEVAEAALDFVKNLSIVAGIFLFSKEKLDVPSMHYFLKLMLPTSIAVITSICGLILIMSIFEACELSDESTSYNVKAARILIIFFMGFILISFDFAIFELPLKVDNDSQMQRVEQLTTNNYITNNYGAAPTNYEQQPNN